jgi:hypothetical protein
MERVTFAARSKVTIDVCARHGDWFDATKLVACVQYIEAREARGGKPSDEEIAAELKWQATIAELEWQATTSKGGVLNANHEALRAETIEQQLSDVARALLPLRSRR